MPRLSGQISVVAVGRLKKSHWKTAQAEYEKRLARYTEFNLIEVKDVVGRGMPDSVAMQKEGELLLQATSSANRRIAAEVLPFARDSSSFPSRIRAMIIDTAS